MAVCQFCGGYAKVVSGTGLCLVFACRDCSIRYQIIDDGDRLAIRALPQEVY